MQHRTMTFLHFAAAAAGSLRPEETRRRAMRFLDRMPVHPESRLLPARSRRVTAATFRPRGHSTCARAMYAAVAEANGPDEASQSVSIAKSLRRREFEEVQSGSEP